MTTLRIPVSQEVIDWAITHGEKSEDELRQKYRLDVWKNPQSDRDLPTFKQIQDFSRDTWIPFNYFFKKEAPAEDNTFVKFRTIDNSAVQPSRRLIDTIHAMESRQEWMRQYLLEQNDQSHFAFLDSIHNSDSPTRSAEAVLKLLKLENIKETSMTDDEFFNALRSSISALGIMVMQNGIVGTNTHRPLNVDEFRAFVLVDDVTPLIFINSADSKKAKIFSLVHELVHALLGHSEVLNVSPEDDVASERWINQVTINVLMPAEEAKHAMAADRKPEDNLKYLSRKFHVSLVATAIQMKFLGIYDDSAVAWAKNEQRQSLESRGKSSGGNFYNTAISRVDRHFANAVINNEPSGNLAVATVASMLGITLKTYDATVDRC